MVVLEPGSPSSFIAVPSGTVQTGHPIVVRPGLWPDRAASASIAEQPKLALIAAIVCEVETRFLVTRKEKTITTRWW